MEEKELKEIVINLKKTLYGVVNNVQSKVSADEVQQIKTIMEGRMVLGHIPYSNLNFSCADCIRDMIYQIISWFESPSFKLPAEVTEEEVKVENKVSLTPKKKGKNK
ncbi:hypothetical protein [Pedobacter gandavensis]|uniref:hypothetical protein n=1 Tax=Pedobacter gandavensis TaxID=2679963 RepID=UPI0029315033|nr:hypothetical protein [Pedobacter gandavensis]